MRPGQRDPQTKHSCALHLRWQYSLLLVVLLTACTTDAGAAPVESEAMPAAAPGLQVAALSRGSGVPEATRSAFASIETLLESARADGRVLNVERTAIGLEGESRLCATFRDEAARAVLEPEVERLSAGVDLMEIKWSACSG